MFTEYKAFPGVGLPGARPDENLGIVKSYNNNSEIIPFGRIVAKVVGEEKGVKLPSLVGDVLLGGSLRADALAINGAYPINESVAVMRQGSIYVELEEDMTPDDAVFVRYAGKAQRQTITFSAEFVTANVINLKIDGVAMTPITFVDTHANMMTAIAAQILLDFPQIDTCTKAGNVITITGANIGVDFIVSDVIVTLGATRPTAVIAETIASIANTERGKIRKDTDNTTAVAATNMEISANGLAGDVVEVFIRY